MGKAVVLDGAAGIKGYLKRIRTDPCATEVQLVRSLRCARREEKAGKPAEIDIETLTVIIVIAGRDAGGRLVQLIRSAELVDHVIPFRLAWPDKGDILCLQRVIKRYSGPTDGGATGNQPHDQNHSRRAAAVTQAQHLLTRCLAKGPKLELKFIRPVAE